MTEGDQDQGIDQGTDQGIVIIIENDQDQEIAIEKIDHGLEILIDTEIDVNKRIVFSYQHCCCPRERIIPEKLTSYSKQFEN